MLLFGNQNLHVPPQIGSITNHRSYPAHRSQVSAEARMGPTVISFSGLTICTPFGVAVAEMFHCIEGVVTPHGRPFLFGF